MEAAQEKIAVTIPEACSLSGLGRSSIYECFKAGKLTPRKHGKRTLILMRDLRHFVESLPEAA
ncbi:MAG: helix-turn-helix domain-containing protein [Leptospiraceae bacterium]|nr:helix-turn-helix domain-containing protein [Leptospiraceae bacterium]